ncbi:hypothetical protein [Achromobacter dolens]|uniref:hypothetical protein n=1 Tax=Achromobacter dolens TaxID=1287738 RepID=UPI0013C2B711|nr:hypothetical protein [Achromobacter dolens]MBQ2646191.1 hypothetical protein [Achromobacter sp.]
MELSFFVVIRYPLYRAHTRAQGTSCDKGNKTYRAAIREIVPSAAAAHDGTCMRHAARGNIWYVNLRLDTRLQANRHRLATTRYRMP